MISYLFKQMTLKKNLPELDDSHDDNFFPFTYNNENILKLM